MKSYIKVTIAFFAVLSFSLRESIAQDGFVVIANSSVIEESLSKSELRRIYFGFTTQWKNFEKVKPSYLIGEYPLFWESVSTSESKFKSFWTKRVFSGNGVAPRDFSDPEKLINYVNGTDGAVGVIPSSMKNSIGSDCKLISVE